MYGGAGDDTYTYENGFDSIVELADEGTDTVLASVSYTLTDNVENLTLFGELAQNATGNALNNFLTGDGSNNVLSGLAGDDALIGGGGNDVLYGGVGADQLYGGAGRDTYLYTSAADSTLASMDKIYEFEAAETINLMQLGLTGTGGILAGNDVSLAEAQLSAGARFAEGRVVYISQADGSTYVFADSNNDRAFSADDLVIELVGLVDPTGIYFNYS